jgi:CRP/FNR family transcriptional regulator
VVTGPLRFAAVDAAGEATLDSSAHCATCSMVARCLTRALAEEEVAQFDGIVAYRARLRRQDALYRAGDPFLALYAIRRGSFKTAMLAEDGREQVTGYHIFGDTIGFDGIGNERHDTGAVALEDAEVCVLPFARVEALARTMPALQHNLHQVMAREITLDQRAMFSLGTLHAEERVAVFLLNLAERYRRGGYSSTEYVLRMTRGEIGSFLGLTLETVSRLFSRFHHAGLIHVDGRAVKLLDPMRLRRMTSRSAAVPG